MEVGREEGEGAEFVPHEDVDHNARHRQLAHVPFARAPLPRAAGQASVSDGRPARARSGGPGGVGVYPRRVSGLRRGIGIICHSKVKLLSIKQAPMRQGAVHESRWSVVDLTHVMLRANET